MLQELIENAKKEDKFIYQRYNGIITKYIDYGNFYINCETGFGIAKDNEHLIGKVSKK